MPFNPKEVIKSLDAEIDQLESEVKGANNSLTSLVGAVVAAKRDLFIAGDNLNEAKRSRNYLARTWGIKERIGGPDVVADEKTGDPRYGEYDRE